eukprot:maker-scaffold191_size271209-snap-gene-1.35 protein:Tk06186 transcript:maker-scaffold191_size271209-snap-gene-1.35-mRNA-1 annotation:"s6 family -specific metalloendopeptidase adhesin"
MSGQALERKPSLTADELTPIVMNQLQTTSKLKEESRRQRMINNHQRFKQQQQVIRGEDTLRIPSLDSGSESCGEDSRQKTAKAFMSGIQSAISASNTDASTAQPSLDGADKAGGLSEELVSEVELVLSKLMSSVNNRDPNLVPLIANLQSSLKASSRNANSPNTLAQKALTIQSPSVSAPQWNGGEPQSPRTPSTPGSASKDWIKDPFGSLPKRAQPSHDGTFEPVHSKTFEPGPQCPTPVEESNVVESSEEVHGASKIPWKIRAARKRQMKHHTTGMTKDEFAQIQQSLRESVAKLAPNPVAAYNLTRNKSEGAIKMRQPRSTDAIRGSRPHVEQVGEESKLPITYQHKEGNRAYTEVCKSVDNMFQPSDLGYASDVCDYNVTKGHASQRDHVKSPLSRPVSLAEDGTKRGQIQEDSSYVQQRRPSSMNQPAALDPQQQLSVPELTQQSSIEEEVRDRSGSNRISRQNSKASSSGVKAKIARRKLMRNANAKDNAQGSLSDPEGNSETIEGEEDSVEQDSEPINEQLHRPRHKCIQKELNGTPLLQLTPTMSKKNWSSRFSNIKSSFDTATMGPPVGDEVGPANTSHSPSINGHLEASDERGRSRTKERSGPNVRSRSAHSIKTGMDSTTNEIRSKSIAQERTKSKVDKNKWNTRTVSPERQRSEIPPDPSARKETKSQQPSGRDSVDYHQYLEMIERFRGNNPKIYSHPLQKNAGTSSSSSGVNTLAVRPQYQMILPPPKSPEATTSSSRESSSDPSSRAEIMGLVKARSREADPGGQRHHDMDYQEYMKIINKVRATKEVTKLRTEQLRLASMYAQEKKRQEELKKEEERLHMERAKIVEECQTEHIHQPFGHGQKWNNNPIHDKGEMTTPQGAQPSSKVLKRQTSAEMRRLEEIHHQRLEQRKQQELRELQVRAEQERLAKLREEQLKQEKEREEIRRLEHERLHQIQEEQQRLDLERLQHEEQIRQEQQRLDEERRRHERLQAEKNALYNKQRLDMEAQNFASGEDHRLSERLRGPETVNPGAPLSAEETLIRERLVQQDFLREEHRREESQIRQEKLNLIQQEEMLLSRQDELLRQIESDREALATQENLIRSRQHGRLQQVRQEKMLLEKQEEMLKMREQQLVQEQARQEKLRREQKTLREQEEAIRRRQEEICKELMMGDMSDTGSESITICQPREGQVFMGKKPMYQPMQIGPELQQQPLPPPLAIIPSNMMLTADIGQHPPVGPFNPMKHGPMEHLGQETDEDTLDDEDGEEDEDYYQTKVEVQSKQTSVPTSVRTIETKLDNPPWAQVTPYLSYQERQGQDEVSKIFREAKSFTQSGVVTSPESVRTSTNLITTPESSLQSQISQTDAPSISSSCADSPLPPPLPPLPNDPVPGAELSNVGSSFVPVQPQVPQRTDSYATTAGYSNEHQSTPYQARRSLVEVGEDTRSTHQHSPRIGGPGSAFKPYDNGDISVDPLGGPMGQQSGHGFIGGAQNVSHPGSHQSSAHFHTHPMMHSKVKELRMPVIPPFSTTDTEPEMKECHMQNMDKRNRSKPKVPTYSTSETEEEYQAYLRSRSKWHGKGGHKNSWDPLLIESPPQITQKPVGIIPKPTPQAAMGAIEHIVERGTQMVSTPIFLPPRTNIVSEGPLRRGPIPEHVEHIQKSASIIEVRSKQNDLSKENTPVCLPQSVAEMNSKFIRNQPKEDSPPSTGSMIPWAKKDTVCPSAIMSKQERFQEPTPSKESLGNRGVKKPFIHPRTNPTIAAMEIMTRKELALSEMEERLAKESQRRKSEVDNPHIRQLEVNYAMLPHEPRKLAESSIALKKFEDGVHEAPLVTPHPSKAAMLAGRSLSVDKSNNSRHEVQQRQTNTVKPSHIVMRDPKSFLPEDKEPSRIGAQNQARGTPERPKSQASFLSSKDSPMSQKRLVATVKPSTVRLLPFEDETKLPNNDMVRKVAERFETGQVGQDSPPTFRNSKLRSKSIGNNLSQKMLELEEEKERVEATSNQSKTILPWASSNSKAPVLRKRDAFRQGYELRMSKSSDHITAAKMLAEARMQSNQGLNRDMSKSIERQIDVYTKTRDDIRKILQFAKVSSVNDRIKVFESQEAPEPPNWEERDRKAEAIKREIEDARELQRRRENEKISDEDVQIQDPIEFKVKPLKIKMKPKLIPPTGPTGPSDPLDFGVPGTKLRINQRPGEEYKSEIRSILRNSGKYESQEEVDSPKISDARRLSIEDIPSLRGKIDTYIQAAEVTARDVPIPPPLSRKQQFQKSASLDRKRAPRLVHANTTEDGDTMQIYAQSATDYSATEDETPSESYHLRAPPRKGPTQVMGLQKSKSFAGQFECAIDAHEIDEKQRRMMTFFNNPGYGGSSPGRVPQPPPRGEEDRRPSITSITDEMILGEDGRELLLHQDVEAAFESLLNGEGDDESVFLRSALGDGPRKEGKVNVSSSIQEGLGAVIMSLSNTNGVRGSDENPPKGNLSRQQTWTGNGIHKNVGFQPSPSPTQSVTRPIAVLQSSPSGPLGDFNALQREINQAGPNATNETARPIDKEAINTEVFVCVHCGKHPSQLVEFDWTQFVGSKWDTGIVCLAFALSLASILAAGLEL